MLLGQGAEWTDADRRTWMVLRAAVLYDVHGGGFFLYYIFRYFYLKAPETKAPINAP